MVCWFQVNLNGMGQLVAIPYSLGGRSWGSKLHHEPITGKHNIVNIGHGKQVGQNCAEFAQLS